MIQRPTTLVLGAGASVPFGFPTGKELMKQVLDMVNKENPANYYKQFENLGFEDKDLIDDFYASLLHSTRSSVDEFLEYRQEFIHLGKVAITLALLPKEDPKRLFDKNNEENWYEYLFSRMSCPFESFGANKLNVVTFNYDRSFEHYLHTALMNSYGKSKEECAEELSKIPIVHPYGSLGPMLWQNKKGRRYSTTATLSEIMKASTQIQIMLEEAQSHTTFREAIKCLSVSDRIIFLGFGYHEWNLQRLEMKEMLASEKIGTSYKLGNAQVKEISGKWGIELPRPGTQILTFLKDNVILD